MKEVRQEANIAQTEDEESAFLLANHGKEEGDLVLLNENGVGPKPVTDDKEKQVNLNVCYFDNGVSKHMTCQMTKFGDLDNEITGLVNFGDGSMVKIKGKGSITFKYKNGEERVLREIYYILTLCSNIISLGQLFEEGNKVILNKNYFWVYEKQGKLLMKVKGSVNRLYKIVIEDVEKVCLLTKMEELSHLWHICLGHVNFKSIALMYKDNMVYGLPNIVQPKELCLGCLMSKQTRKPFSSKSIYSASQALQ